MKEFEKSKDYNLIYEAFRSQGYRENDPEGSSRDEFIPGVDDEFHGAIADEDEELPVDPHEGDRGEEWAARQGEGEPTDDIDALLQHIALEVDEIADGADIGVEEGGSSTATLMIIERIRELLNSIEGQMPPDE